MVKIAFIGNGEPPDVLLNMWRKQTPDCQGVWGQLEGVGSLAEAEIYGVVDKLPAGAQVDPAKCVFLGAHPPSMPHAYADMRNQVCLAKADCRDTVGFLEWWIDWDYDLLKKLNNKVGYRRPLMCVMSNNHTNNSHHMRLHWLNRFCHHQNMDFDLFGRIKPRTEQIGKYYRGECGEWHGEAGGGHMAGKEIAYLSHRYALEFDVAGDHYFSERVLDCMLLWTMPIYWGCPNLHNYLPEGSFRYLDIHGNGGDVMQIIHSNYCEDHMEDLREARRILLDELQLWPRIHKLVFGTYV